MKQFLLKLVLFSFALFSFSAQAAPENYTLDPLHSFVLWHISHFDFSHPSGKWFATGSLVLDKDKPQNDKVDVKINIADMVTGIPELDKHLKGEAFFDVAKYPTATFISNKVTLTGADTADISGTLTIHGVSKPIVLKTKLNKSGMSPVSNKQTAGFSATAQLNRSDFGMNTFLPGLGDKVDLAIEVEAYKS